MKRKIPSRLLLFITIFLLSQTGRTQILADTLEYSFHRQLAPVFKENKVKRVYYSLNLPFLVYYSYDSRTKKSESKWEEDTILYSQNYDTSGFYKSKIETKPDGSLKKKIEYFFNNSGTLIKIITIDSSRYRDFQFQIQDLIYANNRLSNINKFTIRSGDTINSLLTFHYSWNKMIQAIELTDKNQLVLSSLFSYDKTKNYIKEDHIEILGGGTESRVTYYYTFDNNKRINKVYGSYTNFKRKKEPVKEFSYDFVKEANIAENWLQKIEKYD